MKNKKFSSTDGFEIEKWVSLSAEEEFSMASSIESCDFCRMTSLFRLFFILKTCSYQRHLLSMNIWGLINKTLRQCNENCRNTTRSPLLHPDDTCNALFQHTFRHPQQIKPHKNVLKPTCNNNKLPKIKLFYSQHVNKIYITFLLSIEL